MNIKRRKRTYYYVNNYNMDCYEVLGNGTAKNTRTGVIETSELLRNSGFKIKWVNS